MPKVNRDYKRSIFAAGGNKERDILESKINLAKSHYDRKKGKISNLIELIKSEENDEDGRFGEGLRKRRQIRKMLHYDWNTTNPNLMLGLPTKVAHTDEMTEAQQLDDNGENGQHGDMGDSLGSDGETASVVEVDNREFPPHIMADLQKDVIFNAQKQEDIKRLQHELITELEIERANLEDIISNINKRKKLQSDKEGKSSKSKTLDNTRDGQDEESKERSSRQKASYERGTASSKGKENEQMKYDPKKKPTDSKSTVLNLEEAGSAVKTSTAEKEVAIENEKELIAKQRRKIKKLAKAVLELRALKE